MDISVIGISHHVAPVEVREAFALGDDLARRMLQVFRDGDVLSEAIVLDTCNRTEVYFVSKSEDVLGYMLGCIADIKGIPAITDTSAFYHHQGRSAVNHLFRVAAALDSQIVGEHQVLGQLKTAYRIACEERMAKFLLHKILHSAFRAGSRSRSETNIGRGSISVAQGAVDLSQQMFTSLAGKSAMLVGAGQTGQLAAKALIRCGLTDVIVANRSIERAQKVAQEVMHLRRADEVQLDIDETSVTCPALRGPKRQSAQDQSRDSQPDDPVTTTAQAITLQQIPQFIGLVDLVICATGSPELVLTGDELIGAVKRSKRSLFVVDIAVPRDVAPALGRLSNVFLYNIDDLNQIVGLNIEASTKEIPRVEAIIADELDSLCQWFNSLEVTPTIKLLQQRFESLHTAEIQRYGARFNGDNREKLEQFARSLCNKIAHQPIAFLRDASEQGNQSDQLAAVDMVRRMFGLEELEQDA